MRQFWFRRETSGGVTETVQVNATTGELEVEKSNDSQSGKSRAGLIGGDVPRSGASDDVTEVEFVNETEQPVQLFWVDGSGRRTAYNKVSPGVSIRQHTYVGHVWVATGDDGTFYGSVIAEPAPHRVIINKPFSPEQRRRQQRGRQSDAPDESKWQVRIRDGKIIALMSRRRRLSGPVTARQCDW